MNALWPCEVVGHEDGVESVDVENKMIAVVFNPTKMPAEKLGKITRDSLNKLGYKMIELWLLWTERHNTILGFSPLRFL